MSAIYPPNCLTFQASAAITKGKAVLVDSTGKIVTAANAVTEKSVGIAMNAATVAGDLVEVALPGGGAKGLAGGSISAGDLLTATAGGALIATTTATNRVIGVALEGAASGDLFAMQVSASLI